MRGDAWVRALVVGALALTAACDTPQAAQDEVACTTVCRCFTTLPSEQDECVTECIGDLGPVSDPCAACIAEHATECSTLIADCQAECTPAVPNTGGQR
jgi:hypothetical protein